jgi:hypothetical protein
MKLKEPYLFDFFQSLKGLLLFIVYLSIFFLEMGEISKLIDHYN